MSELNLFEQAFKESLLQEEALKRIFVPPESKVPKSDLATDLSPESSLDFELAFQDEMDREIALSSSLDRALPTSPDGAAKIRDLSRKTGFPEEAVEIDQPAFEQRARKQEITDSLGTEHPATSKFLSNPDFAGVSHDEAEALGRIEEKSQKVTMGRALGLGVDSLQIGLYGGMEAFSRYFGMDTIADFSQRGRERNEKEAARVAPHVQKFLDIKTVGDMASWAKTGLPQIAPSMAAMIAAGYTLPMIATALGVTALAPAAVATLAVISVAWMLEAGGAQSQIEQGKKAQKEKIAKAFGKLSDEVKNSKDISIHDPIGAKVAGRDMFVNSRGGVSSELSITVTEEGINEGKPTNIPSIFGGKIVSQEEAVRRVQEAGGKDPETGRVLKGFDSIEEAVTAAEERSQFLTNLRENTEDVAIVGGLGSGLLEAITPSIAVAPFAKQVGKKGLARTAAQIAKRSAVSGAKGSATEVPTEASQSVIENIAAGVATGEPLDFKKLRDDAIEEGTLGVFGGGFSSVTSVVNDVASARKAVQNEEIMKEIAADIQELAVTKRDIKAAVEFEVKVLEEQGIEEIFIPVDKLLEFSELSGQTVEDLGLTEQVNQAKFSTGDVRLSQRQYAEFFLSNENYDAVSENIRLGEGEMTAAEAEEFEASGLSEELDKIARVAQEDDAEITLEKKAPETIEEQVREDAELAEAEAGLVALFESADELGQGEATFESYLVANQQNADRGIKREVLRRQKRALKEATTALSQATVEMRQEVQEEVELRPEYRALDILKQGGRIDQQAIFDSDFLGEPFDINTLSGFPKIGNKVIYGPMKKGEDVFHPDMLADLVGLSSGDELLRILFNSRPIKDVIIEEADARIAQENGELPKRVADIQETIEGLYVDDTASILTLELNALRGRDKQGNPTKLKKIKAAFIKAAARQQLQNYSLRDITPAKFARAAKRFGEQSGKLLRKGDRAGAAEAKFSQIINFSMVQEAFEVKHKREAQEKFLKAVAIKPRLDGKKAHDQLPPDYSIAIRGILNSYGLGGEQLPSDFDINEFQAREFDEGVAFQLPPPGDPNVEFKDLQLHEFNSLVQDLKTIEHSGIAKTRVSKAKESEIAQEIVNKLVVRMVDTVEPRSAKIVKDPVTGVEFVPISEEVLDGVHKIWKEKGPDLATLFFNMDTMLREIDGWQDLGPAYEAIKGRIDDAMSNGYQKGQVGYNVRHRAMLEAVENLLAKHYTIEERSKFKRGLRIEGVSREFNRQQILSILLNSGNEENILALTGGDKRALTRGELDNLRNAVEEKDLAFAQDVWNYNETFWKEIVESTVRRKNFKPEQVIAQPFEVKGRTYRGGFYHLAYDGDSLAINDVASVEDIKDNLLLGAYTSEFVRADHIKKRKKNSNRAVDLDPFILESHLQRVIYDLEVGEAVSDSFKILHHRDFKAAFERMGRQNMWRAMDLWFRSTVTGEIRRGGPVERSFRHLRNGITIVGLGFNLGVAALQPLGMVPAAILLGQVNVAKSLMGTIGAIVTSGSAIFKEIGNITPTMVERGFANVKDIADLKRAFNKTLLDRGLVGRAKKILGQAVFLPIIKMQRFADVVIWQAAYSKGMEKFNNSDVKAKRFADRMVTRTQASPNFQERTPIEQGTISKSINQTETVKIFSLFLSYFAAKNNVVYEAIKSNKKKTTVRGAAKLASDLALAFVWETILAMLIRGTFPDEDEEFEDKVAAIGEEIVGAVFQGVPGIREGINATRGFAAGGTVGSFSKDVANFFTQIGQFELDEGLAMATLKVFGIAAHIPTGQPIKTLRAINKKRDGEEVKIMEYILGPKFED